jgi:hypothetical protein
MTGAPWTRIPDRLNGSGIGNGWEGLAVVFGMLALAVLIVALRQRSRRDR